MKRLKAPERRQQIIDVASRIFAREGYDAATTAAIAESAGVTEPVLYRHFSSKQELFIAVVRVASEQILGDWKNLISNSRTSSEKIRGLARKLPDHIRANGDAYHIIHGALTTSRDRKVLSILKRHYSDVERFFSKIVADGQKAGEFRENLEPKIPAQQLMTAGLGYAMVALNLQPSNHSSAEGTMESIFTALKA